VRAQALFRHPKETAQGRALKVGVAFQLAERQPLR
jgi:hypothetical protein